MLPKTYISNAIDHKSRPSPGSLLRRLHRHLRRIRGRHGRVVGRAEGLLRRRLEALVVGMLLVKVVFGARLQLGGELLEDAVKEAVDGLLLAGVAVPDGDEVKLEADREADAAELVVCVVCQRLHRIKPGGAGEQ